MSEQEASSEGNSMCQFHQDGVCLLGLKENREIDLEGSEPLTGRVGRGEVEGS